jgi:hypothetical protein
VSDGFDRTGPFVPWRNMAPWKEMLSETQHRAEACDDRNLSSNPNEARDQWRCP